MSFDFAELERRIARLESAQTCSMRFGRVTGVTGGKCRVQFQDGQGMNSYDLSSVQKRVLKDQDICMPDTNEPVVCLFSGQGCEQGVMIGAYYNGQEQDPGQPQHMDYKKYEDGTELWYDRENHKLVAKVQGDCEIEAEKTIKATCKEGAEIHSDKTIKASCNEEAEICSEKELTLKAPTIKLMGVLDMANYDGSFTTGTLKGDFNIKEGDIRAESVSLRKHQHEQSGGSGVGGKPVGG